MLRAPPSTRRILLTPWTAGSAAYSRGYSQDHGRKGSNGAPLQKSKRAVSGQEYDGKRGSNGAGRPGASTPKEPSLIEQLFPEETKRYEEEQRQKAAAREIPRLPLEPRNLSPVRVHTATDPTSITSAALRLRNEMRRQHAQFRETSVLVLRNASPNLTAHDFRRLIPQGQHIEGWTLEQGDITAVIPGRNLATLEQENYYYLLFSSQLSAYAYQGHVTRIFRTVAAQTPSSVTSPIPPPPGLKIDGMDAHALIETFALIPASQNLELRQLRPPLSPLLESIVRNKGYPSLVSRPDKSPHEVRLTLSGPQLQPSIIRWILHTSAQALSLSWSGSPDSLVPKITKWEPRPHPQPSPMDGASKVSRDFDKRQQRTEAEQTGIDARREQERVEKAQEASKAFGVPRVGARQVYILGFGTEGAAQSFIAFWHRRSMDWKGVDRGGEEEDLPPVANVEMLW